MRTLPLVTCGVIAAGIFMSGQVFGYECLNRATLDASMALSNATLTDEFIGEDGDKAIQALNFLTLPETLLAGEQLLIWRLTNKIEAVVMLWRGGGFCMTAMVTLTVAQGDLIAATVFGR